MKLNVKKVLAGTAAIASIAAVAPFVSMGAASAATAGTAGLTPTSGTGDTPFSLPLPAPGACAGDNNGGYRVQTFMVPATTDLQTLTFDGNGPTPVGGQFRAPLFFDGAGSPAVDQAPNLTTGVVSFSSPFTYSIFPANTIPNGDYAIGVACTSGSAARTLDAFWSKTVTINNSGGVLSWAVPGPIQPPTIDAPGGTGGSANGNGAITVDVNVAAGSPGATSYQIYVDGVANGSAITGVAGFDPAPVTIGSLTNGTSYSVTATATNTTGTSAQGAAVTFTPSVEHPAPVVTASATVATAPGTIDVTWTPAGGTPSGYEVTIAPGGGAPIVVPASGTLAAQFTGLAAGDYTVTVTPTGYPAGESAPAGSDGAIVGDVNEGQLIQTIQVSREQVTAMIFEQDCDQDGTWQDQDDPPCLVDLGIAAVDPAGTYYVATGALDPIRVIDHRDTDRGWVVTGEIADQFVDSTTSAAFDAHALGWKPNVLSQSGPAPGGYTMTVAAGTEFAPWTSNTLVDGTAILMQSVADGGGIQRGLGTAIASADLTIHMPINAASGTYQADITFTLMNKS